MFVTRFREDVSVYEENFTATIDWGDGTLEPAEDITLLETPGCEGVATTGTIDAAHAYADDGVYTVAVPPLGRRHAPAPTPSGPRRAVDYVEQTFTVTVSNVVPTLDALPDLEADEGQLISLSPATFSDDGFDCPPGSPEWIEQYGSADRDYAYAMAIQDDCIYVAGYTYADLPGQTSAGGHDAYLAKFDTAGKLLWIEQLGSGGRGSRLRRGGRRRRHLRHRVY